MTETEFLRYLQNEIHTTVAATVNDDGLPITCAIDMMDADENGLYFLTAKGKGFYSSLVKTPCTKFSYRPRISRRFFSISCRLDDIWTFSLSFSCFCRASN